MTQEQLQLAIQIDTYISQLYAKGGTDEDLLCQRYEGFYTFAKMLENLAGAIRDGVITVPPE